MGLNWTSVKADHVTQACEMLLHSAVPRSKLGSSLVVTYRGKHLPAKAVLRLAYCLANNIRSEEQLKFASGENSIKLLRSLGFQAERLQIDNPVAKKGEGCVSSRSGEVLPQGSHRPRTKSHGLPKRSVSGGLSSKYCPKEGTRCACRKCLAKPA